MTHHQTLHTSYLNAKQELAEAGLNVTKREWEIINPLLPVGLPGGRPRKVSLRKIINAVLYITRSGCAWRLLPQPFPAWQTVYDMATLNRTHTLKYF